MPTYYHVAPPFLHPGEIIPIGQWGRLMRTFPGTGRGIFTVAKALSLTWEATLEAVRQSLNPSAPSRLDCVFASITLEEAVGFRDCSRPGSTIYEIAPCSSQVAIHVGDYALIAHQGSEAPLVDEWTRRSACYWTESSTEIAEVLIGGECVVLRHVETIVDPPIVSPSIRNLKIIEDETASLAGNLVNRQ